MKKDLEASWNAASELALTSSRLPFLAKRFATLTGPRPQREAFIRRKSSARITRARVLRKLRQWFLLMYCFVKCGLFSVMFLPRKQQLSVNTTKMNTPYIRSTKCNNAQMTSSCIRSNGTALFNSYEPL